MPILRLGLGSGLGLESDYSACLSPRTIDSSIEWAIVLVGMIVVLGVLSVDVVGCCGPESVLCGVRVRVTVTGLSTGPTSG
eukprot:829729-Amorphochlora_amoeboformis.AAC.1